MTKNLCKIPRVDIDVCSAEQMLAYNLCQRYYRGAAADQTATALELITEYISGSDWSGKYNTAAIIAAVKNGIAAAAADGKTVFPILSLYSDVGCLLPIGKAGEK